MLTTARLRLRHWRKKDLPPFAALNSDSQVMEYMPKLLDRTESDASAERINEDLVQYGFGLWAVEVIGVADFIGFTGLALPGFTAHFTPSVEISWRLARDYWGFGFCYGGRPRGARLRFQPDRTRKDCVVHRSSQPALPQCNGSYRHDPFTR